MKCNISDKILTSKVLQQLLRIYVNYDVQNWT